MLDVTLHLGRADGGAGAIVIGKTNSPVMGFRATCDNVLFGPTRNPFDTTRNSGGSSGGGAAAVADGLLSFAEGTDGGGSVRIPASWCGIYGFKQSFGRVPFIGRPNAFGGTDPFVFEGLLTRTVADAALGLTVLSGPDPARSAQLPVPRRSRSARSTGRSPACGSPTARTSAASPSTPRSPPSSPRRCRRSPDAGAEVEQVEIALPADQLELSHLWCRLITPLNLGTLEGLRAAGHDFLGADRDQLPDAYLRWMDWGMQAGVLDLLRDQALRTQVLDAIELVFADHDLLVTPTLGCLPVPNADGGRARRSARPRSTGSRSTRRSAGR